MLNPRFVVAEEGQPVVINYTARLETIVSSQKFTAASNVPSSERTVVIYFSEFPDSNPSSGQPAAAFDISTNNSSTHIESGSIEFTVNDEANIRVSMAGSAVLIDGIDGLQIGSFPISGFASNSRDIAISNVAPRFELFLAAGGNFFEFNPASYDFIQGQAVGLAVIASDPGVNDTFSLSFDLLVDTEAPTVFEFDELLGNNNGEYAQGVDFLPLQVGGNAFRVTALDNDGGERTITYLLNVLPDPAAGDFDGDGGRDSDDLDILGDVPGQVVGLIGLNEWLIMAESLVGDANLDGTTDAFDFAALAAFFNQPGGWGNGDFNLNGVVDAFDFSILAENFNQSYTSLNGLPAKTPEPGIAVTLGTVALLVVRRRRV